MHVGHLGAHGGPGRAGLVGVTMAKQEDALKMGLLQMARWASAYVENETVIPEMSMEAMKPEEVAALAMIGAILGGQGA